MLTRRALRRSLQLFLLSFSLPALAGCAAEFPVPFLVPEDGQEPANTSLTLQERELTEQARVYDLDRPIVADEAGRDLVFSFPPGVMPERIRLLDGEGREVSLRRFSGVFGAGTFDREVTTQAHVPLPAGRPVERLDIRLAETEGPQGEGAGSERPAADFPLPFDRISLLPERSGFSLHPEGGARDLSALLAVGADTRTLHGVSGGARREIDIALGAGESAATGRYLAVRYRFRSDEGAAAPQVLTALVGCEVEGPGEGPGDGPGERPGDGAQRHYDLTLRPGTHTLYFHLYSHEDDADCLPRRLRIPAAPPELSILEAGIRSISEDQYVPVPADLGTILESYPREQWRGDRYELFSWNLFPEILVMDTRSYEVQSAFFRRLAFFVEKRGYRGRLLADAELETRHGWNAHNYRPEGLAPFYNTALESGFELSDPELELKRLLLANGVLRPGDGDRVEPGRGGLISVSRESYPLLRELLLTHEAFHGVFYAVPAFREGARRIWEGLSEEERSFWRNLLSFMTYDPADEYLMINEFQAYLLQQDVPGARSYLRGTLSGRLARRRGEYVRSFLSEYPRTFLRSAEAMDTLALNAAGLRAGRVYDLRVR